MKRTEIEKNAKIVAEVFSEDRNNFADKLRDFFGLSPADIKVTIQLPDYLTYDEYKIVKDSLTRGCTCPIDTNPKREFTASLDAWLSFEEAYLEVAPNQVIYDTVRVEDLPQYIHYEQAVKKLAVKSILRSEAFLEKLVEGILDAVKS